MVFCLFKPNSFHSDFMNKYENRLSIGIYLPYLNIYSNLILHFITNNYRLIIFSSQKVRIQESGRFYISHNVILSQISYFIINP